MGGDAQAHGMSRMRPDDAAYRPNVGAAVFDRSGRVFIARRRGDDGPEVIFPGFEWQLPQGGIDPGEDPAVAVRRELVEETGIATISPLAMLDRQITYDWPPYFGPPHRLTAWRGQAQTWFAFRFAGEEAEIDLGRAPAGEEPEFDMWRWERLEAIADLVVPYKRHIYCEIAAAFSPFANPA
jgi:putative (di)nucleoside polyphosphate hydrolase